MFMNVSPSHSHANPVLMTRGVAEIRTLECENVSKLDEEQVLRGQLKLTAAEVNSGEAVRGHVILTMPGGQPNDTGTVSIF